MTYFELSRKMLAANFNRYRLYFFSNLFAIVLFFCFASIFTNASFMDAGNVNPLISSNIFLPSLISVIFLILFLPASSQNFLASRKQEYGILLSLGMSPKRAVWNLLLEHLAVAVLALLAALVMGTGMSALFYAIIIKGIGIDGIQCQLNVEAYAMTVLLYVAVMILTLICNIIRLWKAKISTLIKTPYQAEKEGILYRILCGVRPAYFRKRLIEWSFVRRHRKEWGIRYVLATAMIVIVVWLISLCVILCPGIVRDAQTYSPYDMVYSEIFGMNQVPVQDVIHILEQSGVDVEESVQISYARDHIANYLPVSEVNRVFGCEYHVHAGEFLNLFQIDLEDGYEHDLTPITDLVLNTKNAEQIKSTGSDVRILFNQNPTFADRTLIVSDDDYEKLAGNPDAYWEGTVNLFQFQDWSTSYHGVCAVQKYLQEVNHLDETEWQYYKPTSKVEQIQDARQSGQFLVFLMCFVIGLILFTEFLLIYFRIRAEKEETERGIYSLRLLGATVKEITEWMKYRIRLRFLPPVMIGAVMGLILIAFSVWQ